MKPFAEFLREYFAEAAARQQVVDRSFRIAGREIAFHFAGPRWAETLTPALAHLESSGAAELEVMVWDGATPPAHHVLRAYLFSLTNWWFEYTGRRGELLDVHDEPLSATYHPDTGVLSVVDGERNLAFYWKKDDSPALYYECCAPFRSLLHRSMSGTGRQFVHGSAVGTAAGGVLLVGKGGSGKSTSALACLGSRLRVAGDDYCIVREDGGQYQLHSLYCTAKVVGESDLDRFPALAARVVNPLRQPGEKLAVSLRQNPGLIENFPLRAILVPVVTGAAETRIAVCSPGEALMAMAPSTLSQLPTSGRDDLRFLSDLARRLPCYRLLLGREVAQIPGKVADLLERLGVSEEALVAG